MPSASSPVTRKRLGAHGRNVDRKRCAARQRNRPVGRGGELLAVEVDLAGVEDRPQHCQMLAQPARRGWATRRRRPARSGAWAPRPRPRLKLPCVAACASAPARRAISGCRGFTGTTKVPTPRSGHGGADEPRQRDGVVVELLRQPDLADARVVGSAGLVDDVVDGVGGGIGAMKLYSCGHKGGSARGPASNSVSLAVTLRPAQPWLRVTRHRSRSTPRRGPASWPA